MSAITTNQVTRLRVDGTATVDAYPDRCIVLFTCEGRSSPPGANAKQAMRNCTALAHRAADVPYGMVDLPDVTTHHERVWNSQLETHVYQDWVATRRGEVTVEVESAEEIVAHLAAVGTGIERILWTLSDRTGLEAKARQEALSDAHRAAVDYASAMGATLGDLLTLDASSAPVELITRESDVVMARANLDDKQIRLTPRDVGATATVHTVWALR